MSDNLILNKYNREAYMTPVFKGDTVSMRL